MAAGKVANGAARPAIGGKPPPRSLSDLGSTYLRRWAAQSSAGLVRAADLMSPRGLLPQVGREHPRFQARVILWSRRKL
jgi:hypothetical protein